MLDDARQAEEQINELTSKRFEVYEEALRTLFGAYPEALQEAALQVENTRNAYWEQRCRHIMVDMFRTAAKPQAEAEHQHRPLPETSPTP